MDIIGPLQLRVMDVVWASGPATVRHVHESLNKGKSQSKRLAYTTILTVMRNLARRGMLLQQAGGRSHLFTPTIDRDSYRQAVVKHLITDYFGKDLAQLQTFLRKHKSAIEKLSLKQLP